MERTLAPFWVTEQPLCVENFQHVFSWYPEAARLCIELKPKFNKRRLPASEEPRPRYMTINVSFLSASLSGDQKVEMIQILKEVIECLET